MKQQILAAKIALAIAFSSTIVQAQGIPVVDAANLQQTLMTATESVAQTLKQIDQYRTQLQQYENMLKNSVAPSTYIWDQAQSTIQKLTALSNTLDYHKNQLGSIDAYLGKFQDVNYYKSSSCFSSAGCSEAERAEMEKNRALASEAQKKANDALIKNLDQQQINLQNDADTLQRIQSAAQKADGQMQAIGYANQLASYQANQLLQIRSLLIAQQNAIAAKMQADADLDSRQTAADAESTKPRFKETKNPINWIDLFINMEQKRQMLQSR